MRGGVLAVCRTYTDVRALFPDLFASMPAEWVLRQQRVRIVTRDRDMRGQTHGLVWTTCHVTTDFLQLAALGMRTRPGFVLATDDLTGAMELSRNAVVEGTYPTTTIDGLVVDLLRAEMVHEVMAS